MKIYNCIYKCICQSSRFKAAILTSNQNKDRIFAYKPEKTEVDKEGICIYCGHYAVAYPLPQFELESVRLFERREYDQKKSAEYVKRKKEKHYYEQSQIKNRKSKNRKGNSRTRIETVI